MSAMANPPHPGETLRFECIEAMGMSITEAAKLLGCARPTLSRVLNGRAAISADMALAFERQGWSNADFLDAATGRLRPRAGASQGRGLIAA